MSSTLTPYTVRIRPITPRIANHALCSYARSTNDPLRATEEQSRSKIDAVFICIKPMITEAEPT